MTNSGIDTSTFDKGIRIQDNLYEHVNGGWLASFDIPADRAVDGAFRTLYDNAEVQVRQIVEECDGASPDHTTALIGNLYASFMAEDAVEELGIEPLRPDLDAIEGADSRAEMAEVIGALERSGVGGLFGSWIDTDPADPERYIVNLTQGGIGLPDEAYYREEQYQEIRTAYLTHLASMFALTAVAGSFGSPTQVAERIMTLETELAKGHWDVVKDRDETLTFNPMRLADLVERVPTFPWHRWALGLGASEATLADLVVREPDFFDHLGRLWSQVELADWKLWAIWRVVRARAPFLNTAVVQENFEFSGRALSGTPELRVRWKRGVSLVEGMLGEAVGRVYVDRHFPPAAKERMTVLVGHLVEAYRQSIASLDWMGSETKEKALAKLDAFTPKIGYPDKWRDYSKLSLRPDDLVGNVRAAAAAETDRQLAKIGSPVDRDEWFMTPQTVNAYYNPGMNEIVFPAAILQPPFFDMDAEDAVNFGGIGAVIGHEIGHGFDDQGSKYDGAGRLFDWWTPQDRAGFEERTSALIAQYDAFYPPQLGEDHHVNGALTIGENIGDLGGLSIAIKAYRLSLAGAEGPEIEGWTALQRLFLGWAQVWRTAIRDEEAIRRLAVDPHSPAEFRCNGVIANLPEFYQAFDVVEGDALYLEPGKRVRIW